ncbi:MAG: M48 family metalloprotease [Phycisphaeraceae bacterium]|nr:MAG: M48 family metalloprotease [Phycisphaeraceae bacterium]
MAHLYVIVVLVSLHLAGTGGFGLLPATVPWWAAWPLVLTPFIVLGVLVTLVSAWCTRRLDRRGDLRAITLAHRAFALARTLALVWHLAAVFLLGLLGLVRRFTGDLVLVDELIASIPALALLLWTYRLAHPIERRLRAAVMIRDLDEGRPIYAFPGPWAYVLGAVRNNLSIMAVPLVLILGWAEVLDRIFEASGLLAGAGQDSLLLYVEPAVQIAGALLIFSLIPPLMVKVWDTVKIPPGELRDGLETLARTHKIRVRDFLIWRTGGMMLNGAVIGLTPWLRYIVLTDALLDNLPEIEVEAVAAHEVAHVRRRHMVWLAISVLGSAMVLGEASMLVSREWSLGELAETWIGGVVTLVGVLLVLGAVSRRFEWQSDAFAAKHLTRQLAGDDASTVSPQAADAMSNALARVSRLNGMPQKKFTWRHGSIATRRKRLAALVGQPLDRLRIDRHVRTVLVLAAIAFLAGLALTAAGMMGWPPYAGA